MQQIFSGVRVVDMTKVFSGPFATRLFADYGAEVIKIEHEKNADDSRNFPPLKNNWSGYYEILNRNKKSISLDLKNATDLQKFYRIIQEADVFVENLTPSTKAKLHIDYQTLRKIHPRIIYASLSGVGQDSDRKYYDVIAQAESGLLSLSGDPSQPMKIGPSVVDAFSGMTLAFGISSALFYREKTKVGQYIDVAMLSCAMNLLESNLIAYSLVKKNPKRVGNYDTAIAPFGIYKTKDGALVLAIGNERLWGAFLEFLHTFGPVDEQLFASNSLRLKNATLLTRCIESVFSKFTVTQIQSQLGKRNIPCAKVHEMSDVVANEDLFTREALVRVRHTKLGNCVIPGKSIQFSEGKKQPFSEAPEIGEDNARYGV